MERHGLRHRANRVAVASTPADYISTVVHFPQGRFHYEDDEYGIRQAYRDTYPPVLDSVPLYGEAYNIYQASPTQEEWSLICDCLNPPTFIFNRVNRHSPDTGHSDCHHG